MSCFKQLYSSDISCYPYLANKQWNWNWSDYDYFTMDNNIKLYDGINVTSSYTYNGYNDGNDYERLDSGLIYNMLNHLFYQKYTNSLNTQSLSTSNYYESASINRPTGSYFNYHQNPYFISNYPTGAMDKVGLFQINQNIYGNRIKPSTFKIIAESGAYEIYDDGAFNIIAHIKGDESYAYYDYVQDNYVVDSSSEVYYIGNIFYSQGIIVIYDYQWVDYIKNNFIPNLNMSFKNEHIVYENLIKCTIKENEYNLSYNPSLLQNRNIPTSSLQNFATSSNFTPYVTTVGLYNNNNELLAVAKMGQPIPISQNNETTFLIRWDN